MAKKQDELALFKFSLIAPLVTGQVETSQAKYLEEITAKTYDVPGIGMREFSPTTIKGWLYAYRRHGFEGLKRKRRSDQGYFRSLNTQAQALIQEILKANPKRTGINVYHDLLQAKMEVPSLSTVQRFIGENRKNIEPEVERRRFSFARANECWQSDVCVGPYLTISGRKKKTYLIAFIDDATRLVTYSEIYFTENYLALENTFREAITRRGIPKKIFVDQAKIYHSKQLRLITARLGIALSYARPFSPESKGKIERYFRTWRDGFQRELDLNNVGSLKELNLLNTDFVENTYNTRTHSSLQGLTPMDRFIQDEEHLRFVDPDKINDYFLHEDTRRVLNDATISIHKKVFEVPQIYCQTRVTILYDPHDLNRVYLKPPDGGELIPIKPVRPVDNAEIPRKQYQRNKIEYSQLFGEGGDNDV